MCRFTLTFIFIFICWSLFGQDLSQIKHIEIVSELQDSMALINKTDIEKLNKVFYEKRNLDSLLVINDSIICNLKAINTKVDSIVLSQLNVIKNDKIIITQLKSNNNKLQKKLTKAHKIIFWESTIGSVVIIILCLLI